MRNIKYKKQMNRISSHYRYMGFIILCLLTSTVLMASAINTPKSISGTVIDASTKMPINAAQISVLNEKSSATTNESGRFSVKISSNNAILSISAYEFNVREFPVQGLDSVVIELFSDKFSNYYKTIDGINGTLKNSQQAISIKGLSDLSQSTVLTVDELLQSQLGSDLRSVSRSGVSGLGSSLFIRGLNSINANAQPLFVVDGVPWNNLYDIESLHGGFFSSPLANIEMNDIESVSLMKDGTSLYGSKASNGVILIKTKRGSGMNTKVTLNVVTGISDRPNSIPVMNADAYKVYLTNIIGSAGLTNNEIAQLPYLNENPARSTYNIYHNNTHWEDEIYQRGVAQSYSINVNGGDDKALYYFSLGYTGNDGVVKSTDFQRYNMRLNADITMSRIVQLGINIGFSRIDRNLVDDGINNNTSPTWLSKIKAPFLSPYNFTTLGDPTVEYTYSDIFNMGNPPAIIQFSKNTLKQTSFNVSFKPVVKLSPDFTLTEQFDYYLNKTNEDYYRPYLYAAPIFVLGVGDSYNARMSQVMRNNSIFSDTRLIYSKQFEIKHNLTAFVGMRYLYGNYESDYAEGHNSKSNSSINLKGSFENLSTDGINNITKSLSHYANADYNFDNRFLVNVTMAIESSSKFGKEAKGGMTIFGHSWAVFPSINGAWMLSSEEFMKSIKGVNLLKIRTGFGVTGNDDIQNYQTLTYFSSIRLKGVSNGIVLSNLANPTIQWETTSRLNAGVDLSVLNERLFMSFDVYSGNTSNLLVRKELQDVSGLPYYWTNDGKLANTGYEFIANAKLLNFKKFRWELGLNVGHYNNKVTELNNGAFITKVFDGEVLTTVGQPAGVFYGYKRAHQNVFATESEAQNANLKIQNEDGSYSYFGVGDIAFEEVLKDGVLDENDKQIIGNPNPDIYGTISNKFTYGNLSLETLFSYSYGNDVYNFQRNILESGRDYSNQSVIVQSRWNTENQITTQPKSVFGDPMGNSRFSDRWIEDGSYIRLKTLSLSYNIPLKLNFIQGINVWISVNNLFTLTNYLGVDPEFSAQNRVLYQGVDAGLLGQSKSYYLGFKINL